MSPIHPLTVHLPIGLLIGNVLFTILYLWKGDRAFEISAYHCLRLGWVLLLPAIISGTYEAVRYVFDPINSGNEALPWINAHAIVGIAIMVSYWMAWQRRRRNPQILDNPTTRGGYLTLLGLGVGLLVVTGWLGGKLVYVLHVGVTP